MVALTLMNFSVTTSVVTIVVVVVVVVGVVGVWMVVGVVVIVVVLVVLVVVVGVLLLSLLLLLLLLTAFVLLGIKPTRTFLCLLRSEGLDQIGSEVLLRLPWMNGL